MSLRRKIFSFVGLLFVGFVATTLWTSRPLFSEPLDVPPMSILPADVALTFATTPRGSMLVQRADAGDLVGVALDGDPLEVYRTVGYSGLRDLAARPENLRVAVDELTIPARLGEVHLAVGTNFRAHAEELLLDSGPFLFPKISIPTAWNAPVAMTARLDYEAELCAVLLEPYTGDNPPALGFLLCNDYTDRWELLRWIDFDGSMGITGFADAKGGLSRLPVGPLLVIPEDPDAFYSTVSFSLGVNGRLRQHDSAGLMIWSPVEVVRRAHQACGTTYQLGGGDYAWPPCGQFDAGTLVLTGTPAGVIFKPLNLWLGSLYLKPGDEVTVSSPGLGLLRNRVELRYVD
jgi:2-keto-4-pentenoate hydratase/2-oxohepta-3-ene-1,7-dioic acid hydratase in catechol pathway